MGASFRTGTVRFANVSDSEIALTDVTQKHVSPKLYGNAGEISPIHMKSLK
jgi:hypothetical protein